ncbi:MAG: twin-arginine translocation signal domain-containing protein [Alphaproteobacteria bacterium]|nr:twin-arginine translocation signal domain-containing protein [Alphaproteobacteria bacterium]
MDRFDDDFSRRGFLKGSGAALGAGALATLPFQVAMAAAFPERNIKVYVPTREGGGADRNLRAFASIWKNHIKTNFEPAFYPGAAGRVGYETFMGKAPRDCYHLLFGNMGAEVLNWVVKPPTFPIDSYFYFAQVDADPGCLFVSTKSKLKNVDDVVAEGKKRTLNVGVSRLAHPASLGALALADKTGAKFNLIPLSGGRNTLSGVATGEVDFGALPTSSIVGRSAFKIVALFDDKNALPDKIPDAVLVNKHFNMNLPPLVAGARAFGIQTEAVEKYPDRYKTLVSTAEKVYGDPAYKAAVEKTKAPWEYFMYGSAEDCKKYVASITEIGQQYKQYLTGKQKKS